MKKVNEPQKGDQPSQPDPDQKKLTPEEELAKLREENEALKAENENLKKTCEEQGQTIASGNSLVLKLKQTVGRLNVALLKAVERMA